MTIILTIAATLLLGACATTADRMDDLNQTLRGYEKAIRWAKYDAVYSFHKWEDVQPSIPADMENFRVTHFEALGEKFDPKNWSMKRSVKLRYYNTEDPREKSMKFSQEWKYFKESKRWYLISSPVLFQ
ncbi:hypothetical protein JYT26_02355 [Beggiatoa alba]|nr:hypothetical protein [Beggiatoa alba]